MSDVTHMKESCHTYGRGMSHMWMSHVTHMNESCHTCECVMSHIWMWNACAAACEHVHEHIRHRRRHRQGQTHAYMPIFIMRTEILATPFTRVSFERTHKNKLERAHTRTHTHQHARSRTHHVLHGEREKRMTATIAWWYADEEELQMRLPLCTCVRMGHGCTTILKRSSLERFNVVVQRFKTQDA